MPGSISPSPARRPGPAGAGGLRLSVRSSARSTHARLDDGVRSDDGWAPHWGPGPGAPDAAPAAPGRPLPRRTACLHGSLSLRALILIFTCPTVIHDHDYRYPAGGALRPGFPRLRHQCRARELDDRHRDCQCQCAIQVQAWLMVRSAENGTYQYYGTQAPSQYVHPSLES